MRSKVGLNNRHHLHETSALDQQSHRLDWARDKSEPDHPDVATTEETVQGFSYQKNIASRERKDQHVGKKAKTDPGDTQRHA